MNKYLKLILPAAVIIVMVQGLMSQIISVSKTANLGRTINTPLDDFGPSITADGKVLVFNSKRGNSRYQDIYISFRQNNAWTAPIPLQQINSPYNDETPYITPNGEYIFFSSDRDGSMEMPSDDQGQIRVSYDLYVSKNINGTFDRPIRLPGGVNSVHHERSPSMSPDLMTIYFTTWPFGDITKAYIMKADFSNGEFINPQRMPSPINNSTQDLSLMPAPDGKGFYFSSLRPGGYGGWDIYYVGYENGSYGTPVNLGPEINTVYNELHLSIIGDTVYFCSNRMDGLGLYDIYGATIAITDNSIKIIVREKKTGKPLSVQVHLTTSVQHNGDVIKQELTKKTDEKGEAVVKPNPLVKEIEGRITADGYLPLFDTCVIDQARDRKWIMELVPIEKEASFDIHSIYFDFESAEIKKESYPFLNALAEYLKKNRSLSFEIIGHTDLHGTDEFNNRLSLDRAQAVKDYLVGKGLDKKRFQVRGAGKSQPVVPKTGAGFDEKNRRTEFRLLDK